MSAPTSPRLVTEIDEDMKSKINDVFDFVDKMKNKIESQYQRWYTLKEAAAYLRVSPQTLSNTLRDKIKPRKIKRIMVYDRHDLDRFWEAQSKN